jgi:hypothetical protein
MKKLLAGILSVALSSSLFADVDDGFYFINTNDKLINIGVKNLDIKDIGLDSGLVYDLQFITDKDIGEQGAWGMRFGFELSYGELDLSDGSGNLTYTEASWLIGPAYTFENHLRFYGVIKVGYTGFSDGVFGDGQNGDVIAGVFGLDYPVTTHFTIGAEAEYGNTYLNGESFSTTSFGGYLAYRY